MIMVVVVLVVVMVIVMVIVVRGHEEIGLECGGHERTVGEAIVSNIIVGPYHYNCRSSSSSSSSSSIRWY